MRGCAYWESTNVKHPGFTMGKVRQFSTNLDGFHCTNDDSYTAGLIASKIHLIPFQ